MGFKSKLDQAWLRLIGSHTTHIPFTSDSRFWSTTISALTSLLLVYYIHQVTKQQKDADAYDVYQFLNFAVFILDFIPLVFIALKYPSMSKLYFTREHLSVLIPLYPSKILNIVPVVIDMMKILYVFLFIPILLISGDIQTLHCITLGILSIVYLATAFATLLLSYQRALNYKDWDADETKLPTPFTTLIPFNIQPLLDKMNFKKK